MTFELCTTRPQALEAPSVNTVTAVSPGTCGVWGGGGHWPRRLRASFVSFLIEQRLPALYPFFRKTLQEFRKEQQLLNWDMCVFTCCLIVMYVS